MMKKRTFAYLFVTNGLKILLVNALSMIVSGIPKFISSFGPMKGEWTLRVMSKSFIVPSPEAVTS